MSNQFKFLVQNTVSTLSPRKSIQLSGNQKLSLTDILSIAYDSPKVSIHLDEKVKNRLTKVNQKMLDQIKAGVAIYGATSAYGGQADLVINHGDSKKRFENSQKLSNSLLHVDVSTGMPINKPITRAAMAIRANMLLPGYSAVRLSTIEKIIDLLNAHLTPIVGQFGTVGASGDLALNGRVISALLHLDHVLVSNSQNQILSAKSALEKAGIEKLILGPKEGLGLANGDNFSTAAALVIFDELVKLKAINFGIMALNIQALKGSVRNFHPLLETVRPHPGQAITAKILRYLLKNSQLATQDLSGVAPRKNGENIQDVYSIRCLPQYYGPDIETLLSSWKTIEINANSISDNPLWTTPETSTENEAPYQWVSGGNFLAMHMADTLDKLRKIGVHIIKQNDRHLARLINPLLNNGLPANLSDKEAISQCAFKGVQTQMGMYETYATILAAPVSTAFGVHEQLNQDITSHAFTSAIMTQEVIKLTRYSLASSLIAAGQAIDLRGGIQLLSPATQFIYQWLRNQVPYIKTEQPLGHYIETIAGNLFDKKLLSNMLNYLVKCL